MNGTKASSSGGASGPPSVSKQWFYLPPPPPPVSGENGDGKAQQQPPQKGPVSEAALFLLLQSRQVPPHALGWTPGQDEWKPLLELTPFDIVARALATGWMFMGQPEEGEAAAAVEGGGEQKPRLVQKGPVHALALVHMFAQGELDGMTLVWSEGMSDWKPLAELPGLKQLMQMEAEGEEEADMVEKDTAPAGNAQPGGGGDILEQTQAAMMVFEPEEEKQPALPQEMLNKMKEKDTTRGYTSDGGTRYIWDADTDAWREALEGESISEDEDEGGAGAETKGGKGEEPAWRVNKKKREAAKQAIWQEKLRLKKLKAEEEGIVWVESGKGKDAQTGAATNGGDDSGAAAAGGGGGEGEGGEAKKKKRGGGKKKRRLAFSEKATKKWVYVKGLPTDVTEDELATHFKLAGILALDPQTQQPRIKLYRDAHGMPKGDASLCYHSEESVAMALSILDGGQIRPGVVISVSKAVFEQRGDTFDPSKGLRKDDARVKVARAAQSQALSWSEADDSGALGKGLKIVVIMNVFDPADFKAAAAAAEAEQRRRRAERKRKRNSGTAGGGGGDEEDSEDEVDGAGAFGSELEEDLREECSKLGPLEKITIFSRNPLGPVAVKFGTSYAAEACIKLMDGRFFGGRKLRCTYWDGVTNYTVEEDEADVQKRIEGFGDWIDEQELPEELRLRVE